MNDLRAILALFDLDFYAEGYQEFTYTARLWHNGDCIAEKSGKDLAALIAEVRELAVKSAGDYERNWVQ